MAISYLDLELGNEFLNRVYVPGSCYRSQSLMHMHTLHQCVSSEVSCAYDVIDVTGMSQYQSVISWLLLTLAHDVRPIRL